MAATKAEIKEAILKFCTMHSYKVKDPAKPQVAILVEGSRMEKMEEIRKNLERYGLKVQVKQDKPNLSSIGYMLVEGQVICLVKPAARQGNASAGVENELIFINAVNDLCKDGPINIRFIAKDGRKYEALSVKHCKEMGRDTSDRKKADFILESNTKSYPVSLKKNSAMYWESSDKYAAKTASKAINDLLKAPKPKIELQFNPNKGRRGVYSISPNIAWKASDKEKKDVVFGSDILPNGCVIQADFTSRSLVYNEEDGFYDVKVTSIITNLSEVRGEHDVWFLVRQDSTRDNQELGYPGLRILAAFESRINSKVLRIPHP